MSTFIVNKLPTDIPNNTLLSLVIPTYNEAGNISRLLVSLVSILNKIIPEAYEIIVVDDNSIDGTALEVNILKNDYKQIRLLTRKTESGLSSAVVRGWRASRDGKYLGVMDGDLQHPPQIISKLLDIILNNDDIDLVVASRFALEGSTGKFGIKRRLDELMGKIMRIARIAKNNQQA